MRNVLQGALLALAIGALPACTGDIGDGPDLSGGSTGGVETPAEFSPANGGMRRLLRLQYIGSVRVLFGEVGANAAAPPLDQSLKGFDAIGAAELSTSSSSVETYEMSARSVAAAVIADAPTRSAILPCEPQDELDTACIGQFASSLGRIAYRRPLTTIELDRLVGVSQTAAEAYGTVDAALEAVVVAVLQSVNFLHIVELGQPDEENPKFRRLTPAELVTRMSFFLLNATPDAAMLDKASAGDLDDDAGIAQMAEEMMARPEAKTALDAFYNEVLRLRELDIMAKDAELFPQLTDTLKEAMREETLALIRDVVWARNGDARDLFDSKETFVNAELAELYGVAAPSGNGFVKTTLPAAQKRAGIFGHAGLLALLSHTDSTSPTRRGAFVRANLLCTPVPPPPAEVVPVLPPLGDKPMTAKMRLEQHEKVESCAGCHKLMDPIGFALEHFDGIGAYRTKDHGLTIDATGTVTDMGTFDGPQELAAVVRDDERTSSCMVKNFVRASMGHLETPGEAPEIDVIDKAFVKSGYRIRDLMVNLVKNPAFRFVGDPK
jgi:hypothetical protein